MDGQIRVRTNSEDQYMHVYMCGVMYIFYECFSINRQQAINTGQ